MKRFGRLTSKSVGEFDPKDWQSEGHSLLLASRALRAQWLVQRRKLIDWPDQISPANSGRLIHLTNIDKALPKSSVLLMGYAIEMYLKASLARRMSGCAEELFSHLSRKKFGHSYLKLAKFIEFPYTDVDQKHFQYLESAVISDARYPLSLKQGENYIDKCNSSRKKNTDRSEYRQYCDLARRLSQYATKIGGTRTSTVFTEGFTIDNDGYLSLRAGGGVSTRITFKLSSALKLQNDPLAVLKDNLDGVAPIAASLWDNAEIWEHAVDDDQKITFRRITE
ncbi:hypothetical protein FA375_24590 [Pseudomonas aeruginosa]|uniref:hypothetical protein n=1 Tax=Pseudomonas aeruginosa TaxID=287 RepID=UPI0015DBBF7C|nr:hypothetical protein [Pseudomonas aeruginosa]EKU9560210.1 hypothetical protein [Pseudomonas aeruginosa]ELH7262732.1 hypothetical protein [Pseudomonas aeruginosa]ELL1153983.1 hypothetical protein [Pseudomonas aeruginosa]MCO2250866.1 hypothetical protein [Pseudomonas aeruginosa]MCO2259602.1 hypothetical protein [Pseudomonas aeruginosa]